MKQREGCAGCRYADLTVVPVCRNSWENVMNVASVWCRLQKKIVKYPYEHCAERDDGPRLTLANWQ